mmetsp:Transcript_67518/g.180425  ORF Transcript_67518/g.180425 Transcript_67518/m.180425 type:complete len:257 (+) Transcript_67518:261-1031(+)
MAACGRSVQVGSLRWGTCTDIGYGSAHSVYPSMAHLLNCVCGIKNPNSAIHAHHPNVLRSKVARCRVLRNTPETHLVLAFSIRTGNVHIFNVQMAASFWTGCTHLNLCSSTHNSCRSRTSSWSLWWGAAPLARSSRCGRRTRASSTPSRCWARATYARGSRWRTPSRSGACSRSSTTPSSSPSTTPSRRACRSASSCPSSTAASSSTTCGGWGAWRSRTAASGPPRSSWRWSTCTRWTSSTATSSPRTSCWTGMGT